MRRLAAWFGENVSVLSATLVMSLVVAAGILSHSDPRPGDPCVCTGGPQPGCVDTGVCSGYDFHRRSEAEVCGYLRQHPGYEHTLYAFYSKFHCESLGGKEPDGQFQRCDGDGWFHINLRAILGHDAIGKAVWDCAAASGLPRWVVGSMANPETKEWYPANCPDWSKWSEWPNGADPDKVRDVPGQRDVPLACYDWHL